MEGRGACPEQLEGSAYGVKATSAAIERQFTTTTDGLVSSMGRLTAFVSDIAMALVGDGALLGSRQPECGGHWPDALKQALTLVHLTGLVGD